MEGYPSAGRCAAEKASLYNAQMSLVNNKVRKKLEVLKGATNVLFRKETGGRYAKGRFELQCLTTTLAEQVFVKYRGRHRCRILPTETGNLA